MSLDHEKPESIEARYNHYRSIKDEDAAAFLAYKIVIQKGGPKKAFSYANYIINELSDYSLRIFYRHLLKHNVKDRLDDMFFYEQAQLFRTEKAYIFENNDRDKKLAIPLHSIKKAMQREQELQDSILKNFYERFTACRVQVDIKKVKNTMQKIKEDLESYSDTHKNNIDVQKLLYKCNFFLEKINNKASLPKPASKESLVVQAARDGYFWALNVLYKKYEKEDSRASLLACMIALHPDTGFFTYHAMKKRIEDVIQGEKKGSYRYLRNQFYLSLLKDENQQYSGDISKAIFQLWGKRRNIMSYIDNTSKKILNNIDDSMDRAASSIFSDDRRKKGELLYFRQIIPEDYSKWFIAVEVKPEQQVPRTAPRK